MSVMSHVSRATITSDNIVSPSMTCQRGGTSLLFRGTLVYADVGGNVTASSVLLLTDRVVNGTLMLGAQLYYVSAGSGAQEDSSGGASQLPDGMVGAVAWHAFMYMRQLFIFCTLCPSTSSLSSILLLPLSLSPSPFLVFSLPPSSPSSPFLPLSSSLLPHFSPLSQKQHMNEGLWIGALIATIACVAFLGTSVTIATIILCRYGVYAPVMQACPCQPCDFIPLFSNCRKYSLHHIGKKSQGWISMNSVENQ